MYVKIVIFSCVFAHICWAEDLPTITSSSGKIRGYYKISSNGKKYEAYEGIPFAMPPTKSRRFLSPEPIQPWRQELNATKFPEACIGLGRELQKRLTGKYVNGVEDCLYLNVYTPIRKTNVPLPVIFWIYGGAFQLSGLTGTEQSYLIDHDIIFVSFNYRHGSLGFLSTEDGVVTGNMGLKDQAMALNWVSKNIKFFGGDPKKISLLGVSAGAASVHYHYLSPMSKGLFRSGISFSGTALVPWAQADGSRDKAIRLGQLMNCSTVDMTQMIDCLREKSADSIVMAQAQFMPWHHNEFAPFGPVVEKQSQNPFIDRPPIDIIRSGDASDVPWITGIVSEEGLFPVAEFATNQTALEDLNKNWDTIAPQLLHYYYTIPKKDHASVGQKIRKYYFNDQLISQNTLSILIHLYSDRSFFVDAEKAAREQAKAHPSSVWFYYYSYRAASSISDALSNSNKNFGVSHLDDVYLAMGLFNVTETTTDFKMHQELVQFWISVVCKGVPNFGPTWTPLLANSSSLNYLHIKKVGDFTEEANGNLGQKSFWSTIDFNENK